MVLSGTRFKFSSVFLFLNRYVIASPHTYQYTRFYDNIIRLIMCTINNVVISNEVKQSFVSCIEQIASVRFRCTPTPSQ